MDLPRLTSSVTPAAAMSPGGPARDLRQAAEGFESLFIATLLKSARAASHGGDMLDSAAVRSAQEMFDAEVAKVSSARAGLGIADALERQFAPLVNAGRR